MKIAIFTTSLGKGGAERVAALQSKIISSLGHEVHVITILNNNVYNISGKLFSLENKSVKRKTQLYRFKKMIKAKRYLKNNQIDLVIDNRPRNLFHRDFLYNYWVFNNIQRIFIVHNSNLNIYFSIKNKLNKILYRSQDVFLAVSKGVENEVNKRFTYINISTIYNPIPEFDTGCKPTNNTEQYILYIGRIDDNQKNFDLLLSAYKESKLINKNIKLYVVGEGDDDTLLNDLILKYNLNEYIERKPYISNPKLIFKEAITTVLTSRFEGFGMVLIESLSLGTPVISVDCKSGPSEIITNNVNGLLVQNHNISAFTNALNVIVEKPEMVLKWRKNAKQSVVKFSIESIKNQWSDLLYEIGHK